MAESPRPIDRHSPASVHSALAELGVAGALLLVGVLLVSVGLCFWLLPVILGAAPLSWRIAAIIAATGIVLVIVGATILVRIRGDHVRLDELPEPERSDRLYSRHLVGIGFALLTDALVNAVVIVALAWSCSRGGGAPAGNLVGDEFDANAADALAAIDPDRLRVFEMLAPLCGSTREEAMFIAALFVLSTLVALLGALFYFANALWAKLREPDREPFDRAIFWAGLWFRIGEAVLFNLVFFLLFRLYGPDQFLLLPLVSLLVGMFLKSGEQLVSGLATRVFAAVAALLPIESRRMPLYKTKAFRVVNLPTGEPERGEALSAIARSVWALRGVDRPVVDRTYGIVRVRYNDDRVTVEEIRQAIELLGFRAVDQDDTPQ